MGDSGVESEQTSNSNEESVENQPTVNVEEEENLCQSSPGETEIVKEEPKLPPVKVNNLAALWEQRLKEKEREVAETTHLTWKSEKPRYLGWNKDNLHFKPKPMMLEPSVTYDSVEEDNTLDDCSSISDTEVDHQAMSEAEFEEELGDEISERLDGREEEEANSSCETSSSDEESASYHGGPEVGSLRQMFEQLGGSRTRVRGGEAEYKEPMGSTGNREIQYQGASTAPELRKVSQQPPVPAPRKVVSMELQGIGRDDGETTSEDETYSETANADGCTFEDDIQCEDGGEETTTEDEEQGKWDEKMDDDHQQDPEEGARRVGRLPGNRLQPFLTSTHPTQQHRPHQEVDLERAQHNSTEDEKYSMRESRSCSSSSESEEDVRSSGDENEYAPYTPITHWRPSDNETTHKKEREATGDEEEHSESEERMVKRQQLPGEQASERKTSVKELRDKFARGRILETVKRKEEEEEGLSHIPEDLRQFFRNTSVKKDSFIDQAEQAEISSMVDRFKEEGKVKVVSENYRKAEETSQACGSDFGEEEPTVERVRRLSMERLSLFQIPT